MPVPSGSDGGTSHGGRDLRGWAAVGAACFFTLSLRRWADLRAGASDLGIFDQATWLMAHGRAPFVTNIAINVFADHVSAVLLLFVPLYRLVATPVWLLAAQAACLGLTVLPARRLADHFGAGRGWATVFVLANPFMWNAAVNDVHPVVFATPAGGVAAARGPPRRPTGRNRRCGPHRPVPADTVTVLVGAAIPAGPRVRRRLLWLTPVPLVVSQVLPHVLGTWQTFERYSGRLGTSPTDALVHPWRLVLLVPTAALQLFSWWLPVGFLPLRRPAGLPPQRWARRRCCCRRGAAWPNRGGITVR